MTVNCNLLHGAKLHCIRLIQRCVWTVPSQELFTGTGHFYPDSSRELEGLEFFFFLFKLFESNIRCLYIIHINWLLYKLLETINNIISAVIKLMVIFVFMHVIGIILNIRLYFFLLNNHIKSYKSYINHIRIINLSRLSDIELFFLLIFSQYAFWNLGGKLDISLLITYKSNTNYIL